MPTAINPHLFVYGTLLNNGNYYADFLQQHCKLLMQGKFKGRLFDAGEYPGAVATANSNEYVYGSIYLMDDPQKILDLIDDYEGFGEAQEQPNLFVRSLTNIETDTGAIECWIYLYNLPVKHLTQIKSGRYPGIK